MSHISQAQICNVALAHIHSTDKTIINLDTDQGHIAVMCRIHYDIARRFVLSNTNFNFSTRRVSLALTNTAVPGEWFYKYDMPVDALKIREIQRDLKTDRPIPFVVEGDGTNDGLSILTDKSLAVGIYTRDVTQVSIFSPGFITTLGWYLASELAPAIAGDFNLQANCLQIYEAVRIKALATDASEGEADDELIASWDSIR